MSKLTLMAIFAHPDDEAFGTGGSLSKYAAEGADVYLVTATRGEAGQISEPDLATAADLPLVRERELRCACQVYGIHPPIFLDYVDGQLPNVHQGQAVGKLVLLIRQFRPQVVISFGPDGIYGHYDHIAASRWATIAVDLAGQPDCFPHHLDDDCRPHQVDKLYYRVLPQEQVEGMSNRGEPPAVMMDGVPFYFNGHPIESITTIIRVDDYLEQKIRGISCHATQVGRRSDLDLAQKIDLARQDALSTTECFTLVRSSVGWPEEKENDLFAGLR
ncbi:MAG: PIG-L family deacetylase [Chloroflexia bacterium]|nr:PIG-L family deacetylase [Chloroflexia bacterium]